MKWLRIEYILPLIVVLIFAILIGCLEWGIRSRWPDLIFRTTEDEFDMFCVFDSRLGRWHRKNFSHIFDGTIVTHNKNGLRDKNAPYENKDNIRRIAILGDSVTWGFRVSDGQTFSDIIEDKLTDTDVINMGVSGYGTGEELLLLRYEGLRYRPNIVILFFCVANDVRNNLKIESFLSYPSPVFYLKNDLLEIKPFKINLVKRMGIYLNEYSYIANFLRKAPERIFNRIFGKDGPDNKREDFKRMNWVERLNKKNKDSVEVDYSRYENFSYLEMDKMTPQHYFEDYEARMLSPAPENYYGVELTKKIILEIRRLVDKNNARLFVVLSPFKAQLDTADYYYKNPLNKELMLFFSEQGIHAIDLLPMLIEKGLDADGIFLDESHFSVLGHQEVANIIYEELVQNAAGLSVSIGNNQNP